MGSAQHLAQRALALEAIRTAMVEKKLTQAELADAADCHEKTVQNLLHGKSVRDQTLFDVCMVLGLDFPAIKEQWSSLGDEIEAPFERKATGGVVAPTYMGAYTKAAVDHYIGNYLTIRPAFADQSKLVAYRTEVTWDPEWPSLLFQESGRHDRPFSHRGRLYIPASSSFIHLVSLTKGAMRMVMISQLDQAREMRGIITTLHKQGAMLVPVSAPIIYVGLDDIADDGLGEIPSGHPRHEPYSKMLATTLSDGYARLCFPGTAGPG